MAVFDVSQSVIASAAGIVTGATNITPDMLTDLEMTLETMELGSLLGLFLQSFLIKFTMLALNIFIFVIVYDKATNKQFITVQTSGGSTFYIVIDYDKPTDEDGEQYQTYFLNMVDESDLLAAMQAAGGELPECACADKCAVGAINTDCIVCAVNMGECQGKAPEPAPVVEPEPDPEPEQPKATGNGGMLLLALAVVVIGGGAGWYFKIYRPKKQRAAESEADYGGEYDGAEDYDETDPEDDGPPWDEDGEE